MKKEESGAEEAPKNVWDLLAVFQMWVRCLLKLLRLKKERRGKYCDMGKIG